MENYGTFSLYTKTNTKLFSIDSRKMCPELDVSYNDRIITTYDSFNQNNFISINRRYRTQEISMAKLSYLISYFEDYFKAKGYKPVPTKELLQLKEDVPSLFNGLVASGSNFIKQESNSNPSIYFCVKMEALKNSIKVRKPVSNYSLIVYEDRKGYLCGISFPYYSKSEDLYTYGIAFPEQLC